MKTSLRWISLRSENIRRWDWRAILVCIITAFTFWVFNALNAEHTAIIEIPIHLRYNIDSLRLVEVKPPPKYVSVNVTGLGWTLLRRTLGISTEALEVNLEDPLHTEFVTSRTIRPVIDERLDEMKSVNYILEDSLFFEYDTLSQKEATIVLLEDNLPIEEGYRIISPVNYEPKSLTFTGPARLLKDYQDTIYVRLESNPIDSDFNEDIGLPFPSHPLLATSDDRINVQFDVAMFIGRTLNFPVDLVNFPTEKPISIQPREAYLDFFIREDEALLPEDSLTIVLDFEEIDWQDSTICPKPFYPEKMKDVILKPESFKVIFEQ